MSKKNLRISSSNLSLRFYIKDGWSKELLESFLKRGEVIKSAHFDTEEDNFKYLTLNCGSELDFDKLFYHNISLSRAFDDYPNESDLSFMKRMLD